MAEDVPAVPEIVPVGPQGLIIELVKVAIVVLLTLWVYNLFGSGVKHKELRVLIVVLSLFLVVFFVYLIGADWLGLAIRFAARMLKTFADGLARVVGD